MMQLAIFLSVLSACQCDDTLSLLQRQATMVDPEEPAPGEAVPKMRDYFVLGHHNGCPENYRSVRDEGQCRLATAALGLAALDESGEWGDMPGGCFKDEGGLVSLNTGKGVAFKGAEPICEWMWGNYFQLGKNNGCPEHYGNVHDEENCEKAAKALGKHNGNSVLWEESGTFSDKPSGCFVDPAGHVFLNKGQGIKAESHAPICEWQWQAADEPEEQSEDHEQSHSAAKTHRSDEHDEDDEAQKDAEEVVEEEVDEANGLAEEPKEKSHTHRMHRAENHVEEADEEDDEEVAEDDDEEEKDDEEQKAGLGDFRDGENEVGSHTKWVCPKRCMKTVAECASSANGESSTANHNKGADCQLQVNLDKCNKKGCKDCPGC